EKFDIDILAKPWVLTSLDRKWKNFKATVKRQWNKNNIRDKRVCNDDWEWLLKFWKTDKALNREIVAKANRSGLPSAHTMGNKSYARTRAEMKQSRPDKSEPTRAEVYIQSHVRSDGKPLNDNVAEIIGKLRDAMQSNSSIVNDGGELDLLAQVMGEKNCKYDTTYGLGSIQGTKNSRMSIVKEALVAKMNAEDKEKRLQEEMNKMMEKQEKILMLLQKSNPHLNLNEVMGSQNQVWVNIKGDYDLTQDVNFDELNHVEEENNVGNGSLMSLIQSSPTRFESQSHDVPNIILDTFLPLYRNLPSKASSSLQKNKSNKEQYVTDHGINDLDMVRGNINGFDTPSQEISYVILKSLRIPDLDVAKGSVMSKHSKTIVGDKELGEGFYEIFVEIPIKVDEPLVRPYGSFQTIGDVVGQSIAWPSFFEFEMKTADDEVEMRVADDEVENSIEQL
ncbi:hypothetical protein LINPERPRIM_LOCUS29235, partial [Linum perenne]